MGAKWFRCRASRTAPRLDLSFTLWLRMISGILAVRLKDKTFCLYFGKRIYNLASVHCGHRMVRLERHTDSMSNKICSDVTTLIVHTGCVSCVMCFCNPIISGNWLPYRNPITEVQKKQGQKLPRTGIPKKLNHKSGKHLPTVIQAPWKCQLASEGVAIKDSSIQHAQIAVDRCVRCVI